MTTTIGKVATVTAVVLAIAVCGVSVAVILGGPNWLGIANDIDGYSFTYVGGENPQWTATNDETGENVRTAMALPDVIPPALDQISTNLAAKSSALAERRTRLENVLEVSTQTSSMDAKALEARVDELRDEIAQINEQASQASAELLSVSEEIDAVENTIEQRRGDVLRQAAIVSVVDADISRVRQLRRQLADLIVQIDSDLARAAERETQLRNLLGMD